MADGNGNQTEQLRLRFEGARRVYGVMCMLEDRLAPRPGALPSMGMVAGITAAELAELMEFMVFAVYVSLRTMPPQLLDRIYDQLSVGAKRHLMVQEKPGIVLAR